MLTFAAPSVAPSVAAWIGSLAAPLTTLFVASAGPASRPHVFASAVQPSAPSHTGRSSALAMEDHPTGQATCTTQEGDTLTGGTYWPCERLNAFMLQMAAHGHCVSAAMMLGHRPYAVQQLAAAQQVPDEDLRSLAAELQAYFDAPPDTALQQMAAEQSKRAELARTGS